MVRVVRIRISNLLRLFRLFRYGDRTGIDARLRIQQELRLAVQVAESYRILAAVAYLTVHVAARLSLHPARRESPRTDTHIRQPHCGHAHRWAVAWCGVELS